MKIGRLLIRDFQQFRLLDMDLRHPETATVPSKICLIGPNGTGKTTLLSLLRKMILRLPGALAANADIQAADTAGGAYALRIHAEEGEVYLVGGLRKNRAILVSPDLDHEPKWLAYLAGEGDFPLDKVKGRKIAATFVEPLRKLEDLVVTVPSDTSPTLRNDPPNSSLSEALKWGAAFPLHHQVSVAEANAFWSALIHLINERRALFHEWIRRDANQHRIIADVRTEFDDAYPEVLPHIASLWNRILGKAGLRFDYENALKPTQLNENLGASVVTSAGTQIPYNRLSTGIRYYLFRLGHIFSLYFRRNVQRGFLMVDEPENSLYPDILHGLIGEYMSVVENTQAFFATHSPLIAAQFSPHERVVLYFDDDAYVRARRGVSPEGDDPNDLLARDFTVALYGKKGRESWDRFIALRDEILECQDEEQRQVLLREYLKIGHAYNFDIRYEIPRQED